MRLWQLADFVAAFSILFCQCRLVQGLLRSSQSQNEVMNGRKAPRLNQRQLHNLPLLSGSAATFAEAEWRPKAERHQAQVHRLLFPGLLKIQDSCTRGSSLKRNEQGSLAPPWRPLDPKHPVYNFLIEYYGLKGTKGPRRLASWSPYSCPLLDGRSSNEPRSYCAGVLLKGATERDLGGLLHRRGASVDASDGVLYDPTQHFSCANTDIVRVIGPFLWYQRILERTLSAEPVLHCYGLHEWAMQYRPRGAPPPPSAKYQAHLPLRCDQQLINDVVEGNGHNTKLLCTHYDALRFFAPAASPLNAYGSMKTLQRGDQLRIEQPACVHAQMDLLKIALKLQPFVDPALVLRALDLALKARRLDVAASPYNASMYGVDPIRIETTEGRGRYRQEQVNLTLQAKSIRCDLLAAYRSFVRSAFAPDDVEKAIAAFDWTWQAKQQRRGSSTESTLPVEANRLA